MKQFTKCLLVSLLLVFTFGMSAEAAVKNVTITQPTKKTSYTVYRGKKNISKKIKATVKTTSKKDSKKLTYTSSNPEVVSVTASGKITCKKAGKAKITVASKQDPTKKDTITIMVVQRATKLTAKTAGYEIKNKKTLTMTKGKSINVTVTAAPEGAGNKVTWKSSNAKIVKVSKKGKLTAKKTGTATITATAKDGSKTKISFKVKVVTGKVTSVEVDKPEVALMVGGTDAEATATVKATVKTAGKKAGVAIGWKSADEKIATVKNGVITAVAPGTTTVTAAAVDGSGKKAVVNVTVTQKPISEKKDPTPAPAPAPTPTPTPTPTPEKKVYTKVLKADTTAFTGGFTVNATKAVAWDNPKQALNTLNQMTKDNEAIVPTRVLGGVQVVANGKNYILKYDKVTGYSLKATDNAENDIILELLSGKTAGDVKIGNSATQEEVERYLAKIGVAKNIFANSKYEFGSGTVTVNNQKYTIKDVVIAAGNVEATVDGAAIKAVLAKDGKTVTVTSDKPLDSNMKAVEALFAGAYTEQK